MTGPTPTPIIPQPGPTLVSATGIPPRGTSAPPLAPPLSMQLLPRPSSYNSTSRSSSKPRWLMVWGGRTQEAKPMAKAKQLSKAKAKTKEWTQRWTLQPPLPGKGGHITGTSQGPGIPHAPGVVTGQAIPMQLREHPSQQAKQVADGVERKHARGKTNGKGKAIKQSQSQSQSQSQNNNKSKRQAPEDVKAVFIQTPENTSALVGTTAQFNCTADGAASVTYLVNNMILAALTSLGVQLSEHYDSSGSQTSAYLRVPVTRDMTNCQWCALLICLMEHVWTHYQPTFMCKLLLLLLNI